MTTPETKDHLRIRAVSEYLWQQTVTGIGSNDFHLKHRLRFLDRLTQRQFERSFAETLKQKSFLIEDSVTADTEGYRYCIGYNNDEANVGLRELKASWGDGGWTLEIGTYHLAGYHRPHQVTIVHGDKQVMFLYPKKFEGKPIPANTLPTDIEVKNLVSA